MIKKIVTVFLSMILAISFLPVSVDAAGTDPATILTDPAFDLNTIDPGTLQQWYASEVSVPDASLKKALMNAANVASGGTLTVKDMLSLPTTLDLSGLSITNLTGMQYAINLKKLNVSNNSISSLDSLRNLYNLQTLNYSNNTVTLVPSWIFTSRDLEEVNGSSNGAYMISLISSTNSLETLYLENNKLTDIPDLSSCASLRTLSFANNQIKTFPESLLKLTGLQSLSLAGNQITDVPDLSSLTALKALSLNNNQLTAIPSGIESMAALQTLSLSGNKITEISDGVMTLGNLQNLSLSFNSIASIPDGLAGMPSLTVLELAVNQIKLDDYSQVISSLSSKLSGFTYKLQKPTLSLKLYKQKGAPAGKLVWSSVSDVSDSSEGYLSVTKYVVERIEETLSEDGQTVVANEDSPSINVYTTIAELDPGTTEYVDETADQDTNYTYRVTAYISGMYQNTTSIDTTVVETVNTSQIETAQISQQQMIQYAAAGGVLLIVVIVGAILIIRSRKKNKAKKKVAVKHKNISIKPIPKQDQSAETSERRSVQPERSLHSSPKSERKKKKGKKIKIVKSQKSPEKTKKTNELDSGDTQVIRRVIDEEK
ncbi:MAG: leucine-rich repeat domain-containing protein [Anaerofustis sp.]